MGCSRSSLAAIWTNFGPYHVARLIALAARFETTGVQLAAGERGREWEAKWKSDGIAVYTLAGGSLEDQNPAVLAVRLWRLLDKVKPQVVLVPGYASLAALAAGWWAKRHRAVGVLMSESTGLDRRRFSAKERAKASMVRNLFRCAVVGGRRAALYLESLGLRPERIGTAYDVVDNDFFAQEAERLRQCSSAAGAGFPGPYFLFVGRLAPEKNLPRLFRAFRRYREAGGSLSLVLAGGGPLEGELRALAAAGAMERHLRFAGFRQVEELIPYYAFARCLILPSVSEPWGLVVNEAMACGLPVLVSRRCGCVEDLVEDGSNGFLFDPLDEEELAWLMLRMEQLREEEWRAMGNRSREIIARYTPERFAAEVERLVAACRGL